MARGPGHDKRLKRPGLLSKRRLQVIGAGLLIIFVGMSAALAAIAPGHEHYAFWTIVFAGGGIGGWEVWRRERIARQVVELRFRCCTECGYSLHDAEQAGRCPECGAQYELDATIRAWQTWLDR